MRVVARNWRGRSGELDLVAWAGPGLVLVEVRTRGEAATLAGYHSLDRRKRRAFRKVGREYLRSLRPLRPPFRHDLVEVVLGRERPADVNHWRKLDLD